MVPNDRDVVDRLLLEMKVELLANVDELQDFADRRGIAVTTLTANKFLLDPKKEALLKKGLHFALAELHAKGALGRGWREKLTSQRRRERENERHRERAKANKAATGLATSPRKLELQRSRVVCTCSKCGPDGKELTYGTAANHRSAERKRLAGGR